ncbi:MAG: diguanylate cyclase [Negativicutes bacterium]|nr:diguanylate cyclase [Negativicutes bacterium]
MGEEGKIHFSGQEGTKLTRSFGAVRKAADKGAGPMPGVPVQSVRGAGQYAMGSDNEAVLRQQNEYLALLQQMAVGLMNLNLDSVLSQAVTSAATLAGTPHGFIFLWDQKLGMFVRSHGLGIYQQDIGSRRAIDEGLIGDMVRTGGPVMVNDYTAWPNRISAAFGDVRALMEVPLKSGTQIVGAIGLAHREEGRTFGESELRLLNRFAELASIALANAELHTALKAELAERQKAESALIRSEANNQALLSAIPDTIFRFDQQGILLDFRPGKETVSWIFSVETLGAHLNTIMSSQMTQNILRHARLARQSNTTLGFEYSIVDGTEWEVRIGPSGENEFLAIIRNVTERKEMQSRLEFLSMHDSLTGLFNRNRFEQEMQRLESLDGQTTGLIICDVDGLKFINDSLGHETGDTLLTTTGLLLQSVFGAEDMVARVGGDEFAILLPDSSPTEVDEVCRRLRMAFNSHNRENPGLPLSISIGSAVSSEEISDMSSLYREADNHMYREKLRRKNSIQSSIVQRLMKAMGAKDHFLQSHGDRRQSLITRLALRLGMRENAVNDLRLLAKYYDIGKVGVPDRILTKPGPLTDREKQEIHRHSEIGYRLAQAIPELVPVADWILKHHEWWNGTGYPMGLQGPAIPIESRIVAIVDAFAAMTSDRPYRRAMGQEEALAELARCSGEQFDPQIVPLFLEILASDEAV